MLGPALDQGTNEVRWTFYNSYEFLQSNRNHVTGHLLPPQRDPSIFRFLKQYFSISSQNLDYSLRFCPLRLIVFSPQGLINQLDGVRSALSGKQQGKVKVAIYVANRSTVFKKGRLNHHDQQLHPHNEQVRGGKAASINSGTPGGIDFAQAVFDILPVIRIVKITINIFPIFDILQTIICKVYWSLTASV